ncbi:MAG: trypsin-like peptidase domain-containing protein [Microbacterium sp.]
MDEIAQGAAPAQTTSTAKRTPWYRRRTPAACLAGVMLAAAIGVPIGAAASVADVTTSTQTTASDLPDTTPGWSGGARGQRATTPGQAPETSTNTNAAAVEADADESTGVVIIETVLGYEEAEAAGTGLVLTSDGVILTNNHVIEGSTKIVVTIASTGETYSAKVLGTDAEDDVAVLQLDGASGLQTVAIDDDSEQVGDAITAVGNAEGGGVLMAADGKITALDASITTSSTGTTAGETLDGMIEIAADVVSGDSGGAVLDAEGEVIGVTTAASNGTATTIAYAIPIDDALAIADEILAGDESGGATIGYPAFLGVEVASAQHSRPGSKAVTTVSGATIAGVIDGTPAAAAGLAAGDVITAIDGTAVADASVLSALLATYDAGDAISLAWTDSAGTARSATITLIEGPAA